MIRIEAESNFNSNLKWNHSSCVNGKIVRCLIGIRRTKLNTSFGQTLRFFNGIGEQGSEQYRPITLPPSLRVPNPCRWRR